MGWAAEQMKFAERVKAKTGGKVVIQPMDEVKADNAVIDGVKSGIIDIGAQPIHMRGELVVPNFMSMPFILWDKAPEMNEKLRPVFNELLGEESRRQVHGCQLLPPPEPLYEQSPATTFEELKKMKLRINGPCLSR